MTVALKCDNIITEIGPGGILHSLFSTIAVRLEGGKWGSRFPLIIGDLYQGRLAQTKARAALDEFRVIERELAELPPSAVVWDADDLAAVPPWGTEVGSHVRNMAQYFVTTTGRNLVAEIIDNLEALLEDGDGLEIISYQGSPPVL
jgi:2,3-bisphosphoglycerate-dependent phosphoglycerate mutase